jgi:serine/threonine protein kinase
MILNSGIVLFISVLSPVQADKSRTPEVRNPDRDLCGWLDLDERSGQTTFGKKLREFTGRSLGGIYLQIDNQDKGIRITDYCDQNQLSTQQRLELFVQVCQAIQHAHQKGIIHRDIKPSNVLVADHDGVPVPKIIDFGIAKATTDQRLTDKTLYTAFEQFIGTPAYMSPEQAKLSGLDIDTRTDIYSLGMLLYELLTGKTPFDAAELMGAGLDEIRRTIREQEPSRPSTRLSTMLDADLTEVAKHRQIDSAKLTALVQGDLDWIAMKALEKDRTRRYRTVITTCWRGC